MHKEAGALRMNRGAYVPTMCTAYLSLHAAEHECGFHLDLNQAQPCIHAAAHEACICGASVHGRSAWMSCYGGWLPLGGCSTGHKLERQTLFAMMGVYDRGSGRVGSSSGVWAAAVAPRQPWCLECWHGGCGVSCIYTAVVCNCM